LTYKDVELFPKVDAASIYKSTYLLNKAEEAIKAFEKNKENPVLKVKAEKAALQIYEAITLLYIDEEYEKIMGMNLYLKDLAHLVRSASNLFNMREKEANKKN
jgi:hypothetical protein